MHRMPIGPIAAASKNPMVNPVENRVKSMPNPNNSMSSISSDQFEYTKNGGKKDCLLFFALYNVGICLIEHQPSANVGARLFS